MSGGVACQNFGGTCTTNAACQAIGNSCTHGGFPQWSLPGTPRANRAYTTSVNTVIDNVTGLEWQRTDPGSTYTWYPARAYCDGLVLDGKSDWRLPSTIELMSLVDYSRAAPPLIDPSAFPGTPAASFWTSSPAMRSDGANVSAWSVHADGRVSGAGFTTNGRVRCVR